MKKPTGFMSNSRMILKSLEKRGKGANRNCSRPSGGQHVWLEGKLARDAAVYPRELCRAVLKGASDQLKQDKLLKNGCFGIQVADDDASVQESLYGPDQGYSGKYHDDLTGQVLKDVLVEAARLKELEYFAGIGVWKKVPKSRARETTGKPPITTRWVDVNKGDEENPQL